MDTLTGSPPRPSVTLVVPNYNHARYLAESLGSIAAQTHAPDQVLIIDDASTDDSLAVISRVIADNPTWRLIRHAKNTGVVPGQNESISLVDTDWIGFLGADDALHPTYANPCLSVTIIFRVPFRSTGAERWPQSEASTKNSALLPTAFALVNSP